MPKIFEYFGFIFLFYSNEHEPIHYNYKENMNLSIVSAKYVAPLKVELHFNDDTVKTIDVGAFIRNHPHPQYNSYLNENKFKKFKIEFGNIVWGKNWDLIFPIDKLYAGVCC